MTSDENNIAVLFARDPTKHTREDVIRIIEEMRSKRHLFKAGGSTAKPPKAEKKPLLDLGSLEL